MGKVMMTHRIVSTNLSMSGLILIYTINFKIESFLKRSCNITDFKYALTFWTDRIIKSAKITTVLLSARFSILNLVTNNGYKTAYCHYYYPICLWYPYRVRYKSFYLFYPWYKPFILDSLPYMFFFR